MHENYPSSPITNETTDVEHGEESGSLRQHEQHFSGTEIVNEPDEKITLNHEKLSDDLRSVTGADNLGIMEVTSGESDGETVDLKKPIKTEPEVVNIDSINQCSEIKIDIGEYCYNGIEYINLVNFW